MPLWQRSQARMRERFGFDLAAPDAAAQATKLLTEHGDCDTHLLHAAVLATRGDNAAALAAAERAAALDANSARAQTTLATLLVQAGRLPEGLQHALHAAELDGTDPQVLFNLGLAQHASGNAAGAAVTFNRAAELAGIQPVPRWQIWRR